MTVPPPGLIRGGVINDASGLNATPIHGRVPVSNISDIQTAIAYARASRLTISAAGSRHSMGGQAFAAGGLVLDTTGFNRCTIDIPSRLISVEAGATWHDIQEQLHPLLAVKAMQSSDIFSIGGSISVNAHGMDHRAGAVMRTLRRLKVVMADGQVRTISPQSDPDLFRLIVGGYGLFAVIAEADIEVTSNVMCRPERRIVTYADLPWIFENEVQPDDEINLFYVHLSTAPGAGFLREALMYIYREVGPARDDLPPLADAGFVSSRRLLVRLASKSAAFARLKWFAEKHVEPWMESRSLSRRTALTADEAGLVSRNEPMHDSVPYLKGRPSMKTDILHEYFVPRDCLVKFIDAAREVLETAQALVINASVRVVHREQNFLTYAPDEAFSVVLYVSQCADAGGSQWMAELTTRLIDVTLDFNGRFFLPYQLHYDTARLKRSYPEIADFFQAKRRYDPEGLFNNTFYRKYAA